MASSVPRIWARRHSISARRTVRPKIAIATSVLLWLSLGCSPTEPASQPRSAVEPTIAASTDPKATTVADSPEPTLVSSTVNSSNSTSTGIGSLAARPGWLGQRTLPTTPDGLVITPQSTPAELRDRRLPTVDTLARPVMAEFSYQAGPIPPDVLNRSTWVEGCPVPAEGLRYLTMSFWGFDDRSHTGEMIVNAAVADDVVSVFRALYDARFPIEEMRVVSNADLEAPPTGDGNNTTGFVCRAVTGGTSFSQHAYGLAIDLNPFHNPYIRGDLLLPELSEAYLDRSVVKAGVVTEGDVVVQAFAAVGWEWGGNWRSLKDYQHFSLNNR